jgi:hypothetical protein
MNGQNARGMMCSALMACNRIPGVVKGGELLRQRANYYCERTAGKTQQGWYRVPTAQCGLPKNAALQAEGQAAW